MTALDELSAALGVRVLSVRRSAAQAASTGVHPAHLAYRRAVKPEWSVSAVMPTGAGVRPAILVVGPSGAVRNPRRLNRWAAALGRSSDLRPLSAEDGHAVIRLLYAALEDSAALVGPLA